MTMETSERIEPKRKSLIKRMLPQTLFYRSLLILIVPVFLLQMISTYVFFDRHWSRMTARLSYAVAGEVAVAADAIQRSAKIDQELLKTFNKNLNLKIEFEPDAVIENPSKGAAPFFLGWQGMIEKALKKELNDELPYPFHVITSFKEKRVYISVELPNGVMSVEVSQRRLFSSTTYIFLLWVFAASAILLIIAILFMRNQIRPIRRLSVAAERFGKGRNVRNFKIEGAKEVRQAGKAFIDMKTRIQRQISQRTDMLAGVSHDLRTPLTRLKLQVAMLGDSPDIYEMKRDIDDMERMIEGYLNFVRGEGRERTTFCDLKSLLEDVVVSVKRQGCDVALDLGDHDKMIIPLRQTAFKRCLGNVVGNALKYADFIWITLAQSDPEHIMIIIEDNGPGIDPQHYEDVFRPFYRADESRNVETGSVGLGMPIAMDIVHLHGGEIWLEKSRHGGLCVNIMLPL